MTAGRALVCSYYLPQPDLDSSSRRLAHIVDFLVEDGWKVTAAARNTAGIDRCRRVLGRKGVVTYELHREAMRAVIARSQFDVAILAFWHIAERLIDDIRELSPDTRILVDSMDLHFVRHARQAFTPAPADRPPSPLGQTWGAETGRELNAYGAADLVLTVSQKEAQLIDDLLGETGLGFVVPDCEDFEASPYGCAERRGVVFVGNFGHPPNIDAARYLCGEIVPRMDRELLAQHPISVIGSNLPDDIRAVATGVSGVTVVGWVPSIQPYLERARVSVVPLRFGAGTKRKLIQTLMVGTPGVTTTIGVEGLELQHEEHILVADDPDTFAVAVERLLTDEPLWERLRVAGRAHVADERGREAAKERFVAALSTACARDPKPVLLAVKVSDQLERQEYRSLVRRVRREIEAHVPPGAVVAVASRGDPDLVALDRRTGWHFPTDERGRYAGFYPADGAAAIDQVEAIRRRGADFLVFPSTALWWLVYYTELAEHLRRYREVLRNEVCALYALRDDRPPPEPFRRRRSRSEMPSDPEVSVVIPTHNRADYLEQTLESLTRQTLAVEDFEVVVVDDGSTDPTSEVCERFGRRLPLVPVHLDQSGIAAAKNAGIAAANGDLVFFFDDDDIAHPRLLAEHVAAHRAHPSEETAVLGYTTWAPSLDVAPVMRFVTDVGHYLFAYDGLEDGARLDFTYFWGGRASCKRSLLEKRGVFRPEFRFGSEDIELGYRLSESGFDVVFRRDAIQFMNRPVTYDEFCHRCERQGSSQWAFSRMHDSEVVRQWCGVNDAHQRWAELEPLLAVKVARVHEIEPLVIEGENHLVHELWGLYWWTFDAFKIKGIVAGRYAESARARV